MTVVWQPAPDQTRQDIEDRRAVRAAVRDFLLERGQAGATTGELVARFGMSAIKRLNDLDKDEHELWTYAKERVGRNEWRYWLVRRKDVETWPVLEPDARGEGWLF